LYLEAKSEMGRSGDAFVQGTSYYAKHMASDAHEWCVARSCCPALLLELVGPNLRVSGLALQGGKACAEPLTDYVPLLLELPESDPFGRVARVLAAVRGAVALLAQHYSSVKAAPQPQWSPAHRTLPYLLERGPEEGAAVGAAGAAREGAEIAAAAAAAASVSQQQEWLYVLQAAGGSQQLVKFSQRYGAEAHRAWAATGCAVELLHAAQLPGGWVAVHMPLLDGSSGWRTLELVCALPKGAEGAALPALRAEALATLQRAHATPVGGQLHVHGDVRGPNVLVRLRSGAGEARWEVRLVDLDWSGPQGAARYPLGLSPLVRWARGVAPGGEMQQRHDVAMLEAALAGLGGERGGPGASASSPPPPPPD
jgi:hypothetical protein